MPPGGSKRGQCRNIIIHGYCRFEGHGCQFQHSSPARPGTVPAAVQNANIITGAALGSPLAPPASASVSAASAAATASTSAALFGSGSSTPTLAPKVGSAAITIKAPTPGQPSKPKYAYQPQTDQQVEEQQQDQQQEQQWQYRNQPEASQGIYGEMRPGYGNSSVDHHAQLDQSYDQYGYYDEHGNYTDPSMEMIQTGLQSTNLDGQPQMTDDVGKMELENYFMHQQYTAHYEPLLYHLYNPPLPHVNSISHAAKVPHNHKPISWFFIDDKYREYLQRRNEAVQQVIDPSTAEGQRLPATVDAVDTYHSLFPIDANKTPSKIFGYTTSVYKATRSSDGKPYILRRIEGFRLINEAAITSIEIWRSLSHTGIVTLVEAFTTKSFGDSSLVFVYHYHPLAITLSAKHFGRHDTHFSHGMSETGLWSLICQLAGIIKKVHSLNLAARVIEPSKILITGESRYRLNCVGILDMITFDNHQIIYEMQQDDLLNFGKLVLAVAVGSLVALQNMPKCMEYLARHYSPEIKDLVVYLLKTPKPVGVKSIDEVLRRIAPRLVQEVDLSYQQTDVLEDRLSREVENSRLFRLMAKFGFINERPEYELDPTYAETGDIYLLKLFRDYVFHQVDENGAPLIDLAHVLQCLNKLDAGVEERIMLSSRDEQSCLIVSYRELKQCLDSVFSEMMARRGQIA
eukprot:jgi/Hompol1/6106/HPOL_002173-RA